MSKRLEQRVEELEEAVVNLIGIIKAQERVMIRILDLAKTAGQVDLFLGVNMLTLHERVKEIEEKIKE